MQKPQMRNAYIHSIGAYAPEKVIPNSYFNELLGEDVDTWLRENLTIRERRWCKDNESTADLCVNASKSALERGNIDPSKIDLIIVATDTPEYISPSTASVVQYRLNAINSGSFDLNTACAGFVTALDTASKYIKADENYNTVLVIGAYAMSKYLNRQDKKTVTLFADGAGAVILKSTSAEMKGFCTASLHTEGQYHDWMGIYAGGTAKPITEKTVSNNDHLLKFIKKFPKEINPETWTKMIREITEKLGWEIDEIEHFFMTQININGINETMDRLGAPHAKAHTIMDKYAYTGSACIPMALNDAFEKGKLKENDKLILIGSGGGLAFACAAFIW